MPSTVGTSGGNTAVSAMFVGTSGGNKVVQTGYVGTAGGNKIFYSALSATAAPTLVSGSASGTGTITTNAATVTVSGGIGPYSYAWSIDNPSLTIVAPSLAATSFSGNPGTVPLDQLTGNATCLVTDTGTGATATTNFVAVNVART